MAAQVNVRRSFAGIRRQPRPLRLPCGNPPGIAGGVDKTTLAFFIRLIFYRGDLLGPKLQGSLENGINVLNVDVN
jgi:hypothetical protein